MTVIVCFDGENDNNNVDNNININVDDATIAWNWDVVCHSLLPARTNWEWGGLL